MRLRNLVCLGVVAFFCALNPMAGQEARGFIQGRVVDPSGAVVADAQIRAVNVNTGVVTRTVTNQSGDYALPFLIPGRYTVSMEKEGFKQFVREGITLRVNERINVDATLDLGLVSESIRVTTEAPLVDTSTASMGQVFETRSVLELPIKDGMVLMLAHLAPGVTSSPGQSGYTRPFDVDNPTRLAISGTTSFSSEFTMDGAPNMQRGRPAYSPPPGVVEEFKTQTATFDASYGFMAGAALNVSLKSGTNKLAGQMYYFNQNPTFVANKFTRNRAGLPKSKFRVHRWGGNASGPVVLPKAYDGRNRTFWMYGYEGIDSIEPLSTVSSAVPTPKQMVGDFSDLLAIGPQYQIYDPYSIRPAAGGRFSRQPVPGNIIPSNLIHPIARNMVRMYDPATQAGTIDGKNNFFRDDGAHDKYYNHIFRIDHNLSEKQRFFGRAYATEMNRPQYVRFNDAHGDIYLRWNRGLAFDDVYTISPHLILNLRYSYTRFIQGQQPLQMGWDLAKLGFSADYINRISQVDNRALKLPNFAIADYQPFAPAALNRLHSDIHDAAANVTQLVRAHTLRYGFGYRANRLNSYNLGQSSGALGFGQTWTRGPLDTSPVSPMGQGMASFLYGLPTDGSFPLRDSSASQSLTWAGYVQDDWRITGKFTLSVGLRYELHGPLQERYNRSVRGFDFAAASPIETQARANYAKSPIPEVPLDQFRVRGGLTFAGTGGNPRTLWKKDKNNFMPRLGLAYSITPKTVVRAGYGVFYEPIGIVYLTENQTGFSRNTDLVASLDNGQNYVINLNNPFPGGFLPPLGAAGGLATNMGQSVTFFPETLLNPYMQRWQLALQQQLPMSSVIEVSYVGNRGTRMRTVPELDPTPAQYLSTSPVRDQPAINFLAAQVPNPFYPMLPGTSLAGANVSRSQLLRPYPQFTGVSTQANGGYSWYHSVQVRYDKRFAQHFSTQLSWTWSKLMAATGFLNPTDFRPEEVISDEDRTHRLAVTTIWELPFGRGKRFLGSGGRGLDSLAGGWQLQGTYAAQSGPPLGFGNAIFTGNLKAIVLPGSRRTVEQWINIDAGFERDSGKQLASNIRTLPTRFSGIRGDGQNNWDLSALKNIPIREQVRLQFRAEFINALNHPQFGSVRTTPSSTDFGAVVSEWAWPRIIQFGLKLLF